MLDGLAPHVAQLAALHIHHPSRAHIDYAGLAVAAAISWVGVTGPGEAALVAAGILGSQGHVGVVAMLLVAWGGAIAGGTAGWLIGLKGGRALMTRPGPLYGLRLRLLHHGDAIYARRGWFLAVYLTPSWMAGVAGMPARRFLPANAVSGLVWALAFGLGAYLAGPSVADVADDIGTIGLVALAVVAVLAGLVGWRRARRG
jgi:membrane protein DedA with SNARE-associated domain